jgi:hypothetical protein
VCGIPSIWMSKEQLIKEKHLTQAMLDEDTRMEDLYKILKAHKKYESDKYFGSNYFKKGSVAYNISNQNN